MFGTLRKGLSTTMRKNSSSQFIHKGEWSDVYMLIFIGFVVIFMTRPLMNNIYNVMLHAKKQDKIPTAVRINRSAALESIPKISAESMSEQGMKINSRVQMPK